MKKEVILNGKRVVVSISQSALVHLQKNTVPLLMEVELYFSCLIKKSCHFRESDDIADYVKVVDGLYLHFRASMTNKCAIDDFDKDKTADFPIVNQKPYIPKWVNLDFSRSRWSGDFGYAE